jgi:hypothetical protein
MLEISPSLGLDCDLGLVLDAFVGQRDLNIVSPSSPGCAGGSIGVVRISERDDPCGCPTLRNWTCLLQKSPSIQLSVFSDQFSPASRSADN